MTVGIESYGIYIPITRLPFSVIGGKGPSGGAEKAVAWHDEDSLTMAVSAGRDCIYDCDKAEIDTLIFASTTWAYSEKQGASVAAKALGLGEHVKTIDIGSSLRAGTLAIQVAIDAVTAGSANKVLVITADCRMATPKSAAELQLGDGAAAFLIGRDNPVASLTASASSANEMMDVWRRQGDKYIHKWEDRFINLHGYHDNAVDAINRLFADTKTTAKDFHKVCLYGPDARSLVGLSKALGVSNQQLQAPLFGQLGNTGTAFAPMLLVMALEQARESESVLLMSYGDGADALAFTVHTESQAKRSSHSYLQRRRTVDHYDKFLSANNILESEYADPDHQGISATVQYRNRDENLSLQGQQCTSCGTHQFPKGRVCVRCTSKDQWLDVDYANTSGRVLTYTLDAFYPAPEPPTVVTIVEINNDDGSPGPRLHLQFADGEAQDIKIGLDVEFVFRVIHEVGQRPNYFWKCVESLDAHQDSGATA